MLKNSKRLKSELNNSHELIIIDLKNFSLEDMEFIKDNLPQIYDGRTTKKDSKKAAHYILELFSRWNRDQVHGAVAEFILIAILRHHSFTQEYCFQNLEEKSLKKGFDGLYLDEKNEMWLAESKSSYTNNSHRNNINKGYKQIQDNVSGVSKSDAWANAYNHSRVVNSIDSLQEKLSQLSDAYIDGDYTSIEEHNVILSSTIYSCEPDDVVRSKKQVEKWISDHESRQELAVVLTTESTKIVEELLREIFNE